MGTTRAIIIGITEYSKEEDRIEYALPSAQKLRDILEKHYAFEDIKLLQDRNATLDDIDGAFRNLNVLTEDDAALIVYCGHGKVMGGHWYLVPQEASRDEIRHKKLLSDYEIIIEYLERSKAGQIFLIIDACYGGLFGQRRELGRPQDIDMDEILLEQLMSPERPAQHVFASGNARQAVLDGGGDNASIFMEEVCRCLENQPNDILPASNLASEVKGRMLNRLLIAVNQQNPIFVPIGEDLGGEFCFVRKGARPPKRSTKSSEDILSLMHKQNGYSLREHCQALERLVAHSEEDSDYDRIVTILSHMVECIAHHPQEGIATSSYGNAILEAIRQFDKIGYFEGIHILSDILYDLAFGHNKGKQAELNLGEGLFLVLRNCANKKQYHSEISEWRLHLRRLATKHADYLYDFWNQVQEYTGDEAGKDSQVKEGIPLSKLCEEKLHDLQRLSNLAFPAKGYSWTEMEIGIIRQKITFEKRWDDKRLEKSESEKKELNLLSNMLGEAFMQSIDKCFDGCKWGADPEQLKHPRKREIFISDLTSRVYSVCDEISQYPSGVRLLEQVLRIPIRETLEKEITLEKGFHFTHNSYYRVIRKMVSGIIALPLDLDLMSAAFCADNASVISLLAAGADVNARDEEGKMALLLACQKNHKDTVELLISRGADINANSDDGETPLMKTAKKGYVDIVEVLLMNGADMYARDRFDGTAMMKALVKGHLETAMAFINNGIDVNIRCLPGTTVLMMAAKFGYVDLVNVLLEKGAEINARCDSDATPLIYALMGKGSIEIVEALLNHGAEVTVRTNDGLTPLIAGGACGSARILKALLDCGADVNAKNDIGYTPLIAAARCEDIEAVGMLIAKGADVNARINNGKTVLMWAAEEGQTENVKLLLFKGADVNATADNGQTAMSIAEEKGHSEIVKLLKEAGAEE